MVTVNAGPHSFFDSFPKEVLDNVLRFFSSLPDAKNWETHIDVRDLCDLLAVHGQWQSFLQSRFTELCISRTKDCSYENRHWGWKLKAGPHLWTDSIDVGHEYVVAGGGEYLQALVVGTDMYDVYRDGEDLIDEILSYCPNVTSLRADEIDSERPKTSMGCWVKKFVSQLEKLELAIEIPVAFPFYSTSLRELILFPEPEEMKPAGWWGKIGCSLEKLVVYGTCIPKEEVDEIKQHCRNLKSISLKGQDEDHNDAIAALLISYGDQLEYAYVFGMNSSQLQDVINVCPNVRFHLEYCTEGEADFSLAALNTIGAKLEALTFWRLSFFEPIDNYREWTAAWNKCVNLRELQMEARQAADVRMIFATPKKKLKVLKLEFSEDADAIDVKKVMDVCAKGTKSVEKLVCYGRRIYAHSLSAFFEANRASLSSIIGRTWPPYQVGTKLLAALLKLPALQELVLDCKMPDDILKTLKNNGVYWKRTEGQFSLVAVGNGI